MKQTYFLTGFTVVAAVIAFLGCESADSYQIDVTPRYTDVTSADQRVTLSAHGWSDYLWTLSDSSIGYLTSTHGESVTYVAKSIPAENSTHQIQTVTVTATDAHDSGSSSSGTNTVTNTGNKYTGIATIRHMSRNGASGNNRESSANSPITP